MHIDQENWEGGNHPDNSPMEGVDDFWDPDTWGPWSQGVDAALNQLHHDLHECIQKIPQSEPSFQNLQENLLQFGTEAFSNFKQQFYAEYDDTRKFSDGKFSSLESEFQGFFKHLHDEIVAKFAVIEAQENCQTVNLENKIENSHSAIQEIVFAHVTKSLSRAEKLFMTHSRDIFQKY